MSKKGLPQKLYVYRENPSGRESYLICYETPQECADISEERVVGVYQLIGKGPLKVEVSFDESALPNNSLELTPRAGGSNPE